MKAQQNKQVWKTLHSANTKTTQSYLVSGAYEN